MEQSTFPCDLAENRYKNGKIIHLPGSRAPEVITYIKN